MHIDSLDLNASYSIDDEITQEEYYDPSELWPAGIEVILKARPTKDHKTEALVFSYYDDDYWQLLRVLCDDEIVKFGEFDEHTRVWPVLKGDDEVFVSQTIGFKEFAKSSIMSDIIKDIFKD